MSDRLLVRVAAVKPPPSLGGVVANALATQAAFETALHNLVNQLKASSNPQKTVQSASAKLDRLNKKTNSAWLAAGLARCAG